jgi:hypothetical protein
VVEVEDGGVMEWDWLGLSYKDFSSERRWESILLVSLGRGRWS